MDKKVKINTMMSLALQLTTIVSGFIIPRQILSAFGSDTNGLINSITQFLNYISLVEGGLGSIIMTALYKPLNEKNINKLNGILVASNNFFKKIARVFLIYLLVVSLGYPLVIRTNYSFVYVSTLSLILGISLFVQYYFSITWRLLLQADRKVYVAAGVQIIVILINTILTIVTIRVFDSVHLVKLIASIAFIVQPILFDAYISRHYTIDLKAESDKTALSQRWDGFGINLAAFLNGNTDVIVLTLLSSLSNVSIYGVYSLVVMGVKSIITAVSAGITPSLGKAYYENNRVKLASIFNRYENIICYLTFSIYSSSILLIVPFVMNYTRGITDANYNQPIFSLLLILSYSVFCLREPYVNIAYVSNAYRKISKYAYIEAGINVILSFMFVKLWGLNGVAIGTLTSMSYRTVVQIIYSKKIIKRKVFDFIKRFLLYFLSTMSGVVIVKKLFQISVGEGWLIWLFNACEVAIVIFSINIIVFIFFEKTERKRERIDE